MVDSALSNTKTIMELKHELKSLLNQKKDLSFNYKKINFSEKRIM